MGTFPSMLAIDVGGNAASDVSGQLFASTDLDAVTPLSPVDLNGVPFIDDALIASSLGILPSFRIAGFTAVDWVSGGYRITIPCIDQVPTGGATNQYLKKNSGSDYDVEWADGTSGGGSGVPAGGSAGQTLTKLSATEGDAGWVTPPANGTGMIFYTGTAWPARDSYPYPRMWISTQHASAPQPTMNDGDMWIRHPDALEG